MPSRTISAPSPASAPAKLPIVTDDITRVFAAAGAGASFSLFITLSICFCKIARKRSSRAATRDASSPPRNFSYSSLRRATNSFSPSNRLGQGGFGVVFRGTISPSTQNVAVKVMDSGSLQGEREFQNELFFASKLDSSHVVPVIGYSHDLQRRRLLLVYELMDNGNLQDALIHRRCKELMDWSRRFLVAINIAEGIEYLHGLEPPVIHGDIKPSNILLDRFFSAKIADFGLARLKSEQVEIVVAALELNGDGGGGAEEVESVVTGNEEFSSGLVDQSPGSVAMVTASPETTTVSLDGVESKEWWWKQESNVERGKVKDYVMQWIGSEVKKERPSSSDWVEGIAATTSTKKLEKKSTSKRLDWWLSLEEENEKKKKKKKKRRMLREWWKDEYRRELAKKKKKTVEAEFCSDDGSSVVSQCPRRSDSKTSSIDWWLSGERWSRGRGNSIDSVSGEIAKSCGISSTPSMRGTVCYAAPEYCNLDNNVSEKCDVYSYGVLLLVVVSGRRPLEMTGSASEIQRANLMSWARKLARRGRLVDLVDQKLQCLDQEQAVLCITVALLCLQRLPVSRPSMKKVLGMLKGEVSLPELPVEFSPSPPLKSARKHRR
ncbi:hypothetical protein AALP_AA7G081200 [Arabis alpina]|uniref:Protein kinase domain-containing protein n=1 Tax=Arabis alpina TaxID=50452 RepID=A0A087GGP1_ARAAL|nr:hypothetical protein AALP_AA7G081200 [Arabis alpina]